VVLITVLFIARRGGSIGGQRAGRQSPVAVVQRRLAAGEITTQQYEERTPLPDTDAKKRNGA